MSLLHQTPMRGRPTAIADARVVTFRVPEAHIEHLDRQAAASGLSRAWYLRKLIAQDVARVRRSRKTAA